MGNELNFDFKIDLIFEKNWKLKKVNLHDFY